MEALGLATGSDDLDTLTSTLAWCESVGVEESCLGPARRRQRALKMTEELAEADGLDALAAAIQKAQKAGLDEEAVHLLG